MEEALAVSLGLSLLHSVWPLAEIIVVDKGKIVQCGDHEKLMAEDGIYKNFISGRKKAVGWKIA